MWIVIAFFFLLVAAVVVLLPFFKPSGTPAVDVSVDSKLLALYTKRDQLYQAIHEAKFDLDTGKLSPEDYDRQVTHLKRQAASVLKAIDRRESNLVPAEWDEQIEGAVRAARGGRTRLHQPVVTMPAMGVQTEQLRYCPKCGARVQPNDRFCPSCGASVA